jgi:acyl carrier protein
MNPLHDEIKKLIIETLNLEGLRPEDIETEAPLFREGLGLDSIDALELGLALKNRYGVVLAEDSQETRRHFASVASLAEFVSSQKAPAAGTAAA